MYGTHPSSLVGNPFCNFLEKNESNDEPWNVSEESDEAST